MALAIQDDGARRAALAACRDVVTSLQNLYSLLRSTKVGPRALKSLIPDVRRGCESVGDTLAPLLAPLRTEMPAGEEATNALLAYVIQLASEITSTLKRAETSDVDARMRLMLEARIASIAPRLDAARALVDLLFTAAEARLVEVELTELLHETFVASSRVTSPWTESISVKAVLPSLECQIETIPRVVIPVVAFTIAQVLESVRSTRPDATQQFSLFTHVRGSRVMISIAPIFPGDPEPDDADAMVLRCPIAIEPAQSVLAVAADAAKMRVRLIDSPPSAEIVFEH